MRNVLIIIVVLLISSCASVHVKKPQDVKKPGKYLFYSLPEDVIVVQLLIEETRFYKGPFADYAKDLLEIENVRKTNQVSYTIQKAEVKSIRVPDRNHYYYYKHRCKRMTDKVVVDEQNILYGISSNSPRINSFPAFSYLKNSNYPEIPFADACNNGTKKEVTDTTYKTTFIDSTFVKVPVLKTSLSAKTTADKAEDAANHLMRIRKRTFKFISGAYETVPQPQTTEAILQELGREESEYLSLFTGKEYSSRYLVSLHLTPGTDTTHIIAWFSDKTGLSAVQKPGYVPLAIELDELGHLDTLKKYQTIPDKKRINGIVYRIPARTRVSLKMNNALILQKDMLISQKGLLSVYPAVAVKKTKNGVVLHPVSE